MKSPQPFPVVVFDAYGTLVEMPDPTRPFHQLKEIIRGQGVATPDYAQRAMGERHFFASLAQSYGATVPMGCLAGLERDLFDELDSARLFSDALFAIRHVLDKGATVVIASNLAWPYALPVKHLLQQVEGGMGSRVGAGRVRYAFSFDMGRVKPDPGFYQDIEKHLRQAGAGPFFMVGDRQLEDVDGPRAQGWEAWRLDRSSGAGLMDAPWEKWFCPLK